ncbi:acyl-CoA/acyl-ACP dehydrogenase [Nocardia sp. NBC_00565]|uniref:acyl-CoA dehydrogenase family protein n=1 Tax=Nocardia sp. NBC_00565 TaxID=2975993 RepID=UPI002E81D8E4|nr:acyl-CoA dehydrogenase family protein [Nocardia sp. NBC_00565]WUC06613.1 acyl-CoA/acyl-ACP dehydrogenase [Nocardia sp. NBC_00565]
MSATAGRADAELEAIVNRFFEQRCTTEVVSVAEREGMPSDLWDATEELGFTAVGIPEEAGGSGGSLEDALAVHRAVGMHAVPLPIAEKYLAGWLIASAGLTIDARPATVVPSTSPLSLEVVDGRATGVVEDVPWGSRASVVVGLVESEGTGQNKVVLLDPATATIRHGSDYANQPRDTLVFREAPVQVVPVSVSRVELTARAGLVRAAQMVGAMNKTSALTQKYTSERHQFGRSIDSFPAVKEHLVVLAQMAAMAELSVERAADAASSADGVFECLAAKLVTSENAEHAVRAAHQAHGAIGMTKEYPLHRYTRRLQAWRSEFGTVSELSKMIGHGAAGVSSIAHLVTADQPHLSNLKGE